MTLKGGWTVCIERTTRQRVSSSLQCKTKWGCWVVIKVGEEPRTPKSTHAIRPTEEECSVARVVDFVVSDLQHTHKHSQTLTLAHTHTYRQTHTRARAYTPTQTAKPSRQ